MTRTQFILIVWIILLCGCQEQEHIETEQDPCYTSSTWPEDWCEDLTKINMFTEEASFVISNWLEPIGDDPNNVFNLRHFNWLAKRGLVLERKSE